MNHTTTEWGYLLQDDKKIYHIKYKDLDYASYAGLLFKTFAMGKKVKGFHVITESGGKLLVSSKQTKIKSRGGFESTYMRYEIAVIEKEKVLETLVFTDEKTNKAIDVRNKIIPMIKNHFSDCTKLLERISLFESPASDASRSTILVFLNDPVNLNCN